MLMESQALCRGTIKLPYIIAEFDVSKPNATCQVFELKSNEEMRKSWVIKRLPTLTVATRTATQTFILSCNSCVRFDINVYNNTTRNDITAWKGFKMNKTQRNQYSRHS